MNCQNGSLTDLDHRAVALVVVDVIVHLAVCHDRICFIEIHQAMAVCILIACHDTAGQSCRAASGAHKAAGAGHDVVCHRAVFHFQGAVAQDHTFGLESAAGKTDAVCFESAGAVIVNGTGKDTAGSFVGKDQSAAVIDDSEVLTVIIQGRDNAVAVHVDRDGLAFGNTEGIAFIAGFNVIFENKHIAG